MVKENQNTYQLIEKQIADLFRVEDELLKIFESRQNALNEKQGGLFAISDDYMGLSKKLSDLFEKNIKDFKIVPFTKTCRNFESIKILFDNYQDQLIDLQSKDRYYATGDDVAFMRLKKFVKRRILKTNWFFVGIGNLFRKAPKEKQYALHKIPERALAEYVFLNQFLWKLLPVYKRLNQNKAERIRQFYQLDSELEKHYLFSLDSQEFGPQLIKLKESIRQDKEYLSLFFENIESELEIIFDDLRSKIGTIEFSSKSVSRKRLEAESSHLLKNFDTSQQHLQLTQYALAEHWRLKLQNRKLVFQLLDQFNLQADEIGNQLDDVLKSAFIELKKELQLFTDSVADEKVKLQDHALKIKDFIQDRIPKLSLMLIQSRISYLFEKPLIELEKELQKTPETLQFASAVFEGSEVRSKSFRTVKSRQLLQGAVLEILRKQFAVEQKAFAGTLLQLNINLTEIQHVVEYTVDYCLEQSDISVGLNELSEGMQRSVGKSEDNLVFLATLKDQYVSALKTMCFGFAEKTAQYFEPGRLHQSEKINQRRAFINEKKLLLLQSWQQTVLFSKKSFRWIKELYAVSNDRYFNLRNLLGISDEKESISTELSNYLSETRNAIGRLPVMYQKLFENSPLSGDRFYIPRKTELKELSSAYENWKKGNFAPTCLVGEQGSGATTIFNFFTASIQDEIQVEHYILKENRYLKEDFVAFIRDIFPDFKEDNFDDLVSRINALPERKVIVLENIHNLFIRKNNAFGNLFLLFKLMSQTNQKICWVCSCFIYSWKLLDYTLNISGYFAHIIYFELMSAEIIREAIMKRHKVSGFNLSFLEPDHITHKRGYQKLSESEKQAYLEEVFFEELWNDAQANMTMAFVFWLRAIVKVEDDTFFIQQKKMSFSFLNSLMTSELTSLHGILIHGGLTIQEHALVFKTTEENSSRQLMVLTDDGLLELRDNKYVINPLLYRTLVSQLKSLNFIY